MCLLDRGTGTTQQNRDYYHGCSPKACSYVIGTQ